MIRNLMEALPISTAKRFMKISGGKYKTLYPEIFKDGKDRQYFKYNQEVSVEDSPVYDSIKEYLKKLGYEIIDYKKGIAKDVSGKFDKSGKQQFKIGKLLKDNAELLKSFSTDPIRSGGEFKIVICRHPYDVAGMTSDRAWHNTSCMNLISGCNRRYVDEDVKYGTLIAYLINRGDDNITKPYSRVLIKPYKAEDGEIYLNTHTRAYGMNDELFLKTVKGIVDELYNKDRDLTNKTYKRNPKLYADVSMGKKEPETIGKRTHSDNPKIDAIKKAFGVDDENDITEESRNEFRCAASDEGEILVLVLDEDERRDSARDAIDDGIQDGYYTISEYDLDNYMTERGKRYFDDIREESNRTYVDEIDSESDDKFDSRLISELYDREILTDEDFETDEDGEIDYKTLKDEVRLEDKKDEYVEDMNGREDGVDWYKSNFGDEDFYNIIKDDYFDREAYIDSELRFAEYGHLLGRYDGEEHYATIDGTDYYLYRVE